MVNIISEILLGSLNYTFIKNLFIFYLFKDYLEAKGHKIIELRKAKNWNNLELFVNGDQYLNANKTN